MRTRASSQGLIPNWMWLVWGIAAGFLLVMSLAGCASAVDRTIANAQKTWAAAGTYESVESPNAERALAMLTARVEALEITVVFEPMKPELFGYAERENGVVHIRAGLNTTQKLEVLAHEVTHILAPEILHQDVREIFSEMVMVEVTRRLGVDSSKASSGYMSIYKSGIPGALQYRSDMEQIVKILTDPKVVFGEKQW